MNIEEVKESIYRKGFEQDLYPELEKEIAAGNPEIILGKTQKVDEDEVSFKLHIRNDIENEQIYFNKIEVLLKQANGEEREHKFSTDKKITAMEAYRMMKFGDKVSVNKDLYKDGQSYNTWLSLAVDKEKDENGNYQYNSYHQNYYAQYPFNLREELGKLPVPVKQLENPGNLEWIEKSLKKANLIPVAIMLNGVETSGFLGVNPEKGKVVLYDTDLNLVVQVDQKQDNSIAGHQVQDNGNSSKKDATPQNEEVKKKDWNNQVDWKKNHNKGQRL